MDGFLQKATQFAEQQFENSESGSANRTASHRIASHRIASHRITPVQQVLLSSLALLFSARIVD
jgi:hypothetical protein